MVLETLSFIKCILVLLVMLCDVMWYFDHMWCRDALEIFLAICMCHDTMWWELRESVFLFSSNNINGTAYCNEFVKLDSITLLKRNFQHFQWILMMTENKYFSLTLTERNLHECFRWILLVRECHFTVWYMKQGVAQNSQVLCKISNFAYHAYTIYNTQYTHTL